MNENELSLDTNNNSTSNNTKFCKHCGKIIDKDVVICLYCGKQVEELQSSASNTPNNIVNNVENSSSNNNINSGFYGMRKPKNKWISFLLCLFLGLLGAHKFYEGKIIFGIVYIFTFGLFGFGILVDLILIILKPNPYFV